MTEAIMKNGNSCDHSPLHPRFFLSKDPYAEGEEQKTDEFGQKRRSRIQYKLISAIQRYYKQPSFIPTLNIANGSKRQQRTERREACVALLESMIYHMDLVSLRVGYPGRKGEGDFIYRTMEFLSEKAGISYSRAKRAMKDLKASGIISVKRACRKNDDDTYTGLASTKCFSRDFMALLGFHKWMNKERKKASQRQVDKQVKDHREAQRSPRARATSAMMSRMLIAGLDTGFDSDSPPTDQDTSK